MSNAFLPSEPAGRSVRKLSADVPAFVRDEIFSDPEKPRIFRGLASQPHRVRSMKPVSTAMRCSEPWSSSGTEAESSPMGSGRSKRYHGDDAEPLYSPDQKIRPNFFAPS